jgi:Phage integrase family
MSSVVAWQGPKSHIAWAEDLQAGQARQLMSAVHCRAYQRLRTPCCSTCLLFGAGAYLCHGDSGLCVTALKLRRHRQSADRRSAGDAWIETGLVFTSRHGTPVQPSNFDRSFNRRIAKAGVPKISRHTTPKTCGSLLAALDVQPRVAMQILRHSKIAITMQIYTEVPSSATRDALRKLGQWLDEPSS